MTMMSNHLVEKDHLFCHTMFFFIEECFYIKYENACRERERERERNKLIQ